MCPSQGFDQFLHLRVAAITIGISTAAAPIHHQRHYAPAVTMTLPHTALIPTTHSFISSSIRSISVHNPEISCCCSVSRWASAGIVRFSFERSHGLGCVQLGLEGGVSVTSQVNMFSWGISGGSGGRSAASAGRFGQLVRLDQRRRQRGCLQRPSLGRRVAGAEVRAAAAALRHGCLFILW